MALNSMRSLHNTIKLVSCEQKTLQGKFSRLEDQKHFSFSVSRSSLPSFLCHFVPFFTALPVLPFILPLFHPLFGLPVELFSMKKEKNQISGLQKSHLAVVFHRRTHRLMSIYALCLTTTFQHLTQILVGSCWRLCELRRTHPFQGCFKDKVEMCGFPGTVTFTIILILMYCVVTRISVESLYLFFQVIILVLQPVILLLWSTISPTTC